ncbi:MAG: valine--tRNA ligase [Alphaproteobacteria bacterium]|nr:valine--tRNA ligase [Alphaproteobacteria bacterium]
MLEKTYNPKDSEEQLYDAWEASGAFRAGNKPDAKPFTIVIPPPNVTGSLHIGHALNNTLQDILSRFERMRGRDVLWQPGMDHAGIATQLVVERQLAEKQTSRQKLGREEFLRRVWEWKAESGGTIMRQLRRLGASCDWSRDRFTMGETEADQMSRAVLKVFVELYKQGLMYKDTRLVNWDPRLQTAVSDLEVENIEVKGNLWHIKYPLADKPDEFIIVATTRPETMLGDTAVAVHPDDERYKALVGKKVRLPLSERLIPIVADEYADPEKGSGAVKITPAHDFNDYEVGRRHKFEPLNILTLDGKINDKAAAPYRGLDRFEARKRVVADLEAMGLLEKVEPVTHAVPHDEKTKTVVLEPMLTEQWYLNVKPLADRALESVRSGQTKFVPERFADTYYRWLEDIRPWCVSRQLWWGHQIPAWYDDKGNIFVAETEADALAQAKAKHGHDVALKRDPDVLDTWFSSGLWPFSTMGWPDKTPELARYYPTDVVVTMFDIIFFWVARMMMFGLHFMDKEPFHTIYIHARVVDERGQKMSKTRGNVIDPLTLIDEFGADALRFALAIAAAAGKDLRMGRSRVEVYRNFCTKIWNAARFCEMNECKRVDGFDPSALKGTVNRWIVGELFRARDEVTKALETYRFNDAAGGLYEFVWNVYCDWYLEFIKPVLNGSDEAQKAETRATAAWVMDEMLRLMHPFTPFITEELWRQTGEQGPKRESMLISAAWPDYSKIARDTAAASEMNWVKSLISEVRSVRAEMNVPPASKLPLTLKTANADERAWLDRHNELILRMARLDAAQAGDAFAKSSAQIVVGDGTAGLALEGFIDFAKERARLTKEQQRLTAEIGRIDAKLGNEAFVAKAPEEVIDEQREKRAEYEAALGKVTEALKRLG